MAGQPPPRQTSPNGYGTINGALNIAGLGNGANNGGPCSFTFGMPPPEKGRWYLEFAKTAMQGLLSQRDSIIFPEQDLAVRAFDVAEAMCAEYERRGGSFPT